jgi:cytochrome c oxidase subunit II
VRRGRLPRKIETHISGMEGDFRMSLSMRQLGRLVSVLTAASLAMWPAIALASISRPNWHPGGSPFSPITNPGSGEAQSISNLFWIILGLSGIIFAGIVVAIILCIVKFSAKPDSPIPRQVFGNKNVEITWTAIPTVLLVITFIATVVDIRSINEAHGGRILNIYAVGHQWWWEFHYTSGQQYINSDIFTADEVHIPTNETIHFHVESADVIHSFWIPQIARQEDANPGQDNAVFVPPISQPGTFDGACYEYCGDAHAWMKFRLVINTPAQFKAWAVQQQKNAATPAAGTLAAAGYKIFISNTCVECHNVAGTPAGAVVAPNLTHVASRWTLGGGALTVSPATIQMWIRNPDQYKPGVLMPRYPYLSNKDIKALAAYLYTLK